MQSLCFGQMQMRYEDFWFNYDLSELGNAIQGFNEREERLNKEQWEQTRIIYSAVLNKPIYGYKIKPKAPDKLLPFPWDNEGSAPDKEVLEELRKELWPQKQ